MWLTTLSSWIFQSEPNPLELVPLVRDAGIIGLLVVIVVGALREWWVPGGTYRQMREERDEWRRLALQGTEMATRSTSLADQVVRKGSG